LFAGLSVVERREGKTQFRNWEALLRVGAEAYLLAGRGRDAEQVTAGIRSLSDFERTRILEV